MTIVGLFSCSQPAKYLQDSKSTLHENTMQNGTLFEEFISKFKQISLADLNNLESEFNNNFLAKEYQLEEVADTFKLSFLEDVNTKYIYYGFVTELPNKSKLITFLNHYGAKDNRSGEVVDTTFFESIIYDFEGEFQCSFKSFGSNLTGAPPTYNMVSTFEFEKDRLIIINKEFSTGTSYGQSEPISSQEPTVYQANLVVKKYQFKYESNEISLIDNSTGKIKVEEFYPDTQPVYLKLLK